MADPFDKGLGLAGVDSSFREDADSKNAFDAALGDWERGERVRARGVPVVWFKFLRMEDGMDSPVGR